MNDKGISKFSDIIESKENKNIDFRFYSKNLLYEIMKELNKDHVLDDKEKLALFLIRVTAELKDPNDRCSAALKGDSSSGKDNAIKTILKHFPEEDNFFLTRGTQSAIEQVAQTVKCIAFSEINKNRENGANSELTEVFKQLAEDGVNIIKGDASTGYQTITNIKSEQKTLLYGTTETESDTELESRYVIIPIRSDLIKNKAVIHDSLNKCSDFNYYLKKNSKKESWISKSIRNLDKDLFVIIPFAKKLKEKIKDIDGKEKDLFDLSKERVKRDSKRLLALTKAITFLHQKQRKISIKKGIKFLESDPADFLAAILIFAEFFNLTYSGLDHRLQKCLGKIRELENKHDSEIIKFGFDITKYSGFVIRHLLQEELGITSVNTMKKHIEKLKDLGYIESSFYDHSIPKAYLIKSEGINQGVNRVSLPISMTALIPYMIPKITPSNIENIEESLDFGTISLNFLKKGVYPKKNDTLKNDTLNNKKDTHGNKLSNNSFNDLDFIDLIKINDKGKGVNIWNLEKLTNFKEDIINKEIDRLSQNGEIYEVSSGNYKVME